MATTLYDDIQDLLKAIIEHADETEEYKAQSDELCKNWKERIPLQLLQLKKLNHYSIIEDLLNTGSLLHQKMCGLMNI